MVLIQYKREGDGILVEDYVVVVGNVRWFVNNSLYTTHILLEGYLTHKECAGDGLGVNILEREPPDALLQQRQRHKHLSQEIICIDVILIPRLQNQC